MVGGRTRSSLVLALSIAAAGVPFGCDENDSSSSDTSASGGSGGAAGNNSGGSFVVRGGSGGAAGASSGGTATCPTGGSGATGSADGGQAGDGSALACGLILYPTRVYGPDCQAWMEEYCCPSMEECAGNSICKNFIDCVNACNPTTQTCIGCCGRGLVAVPAELDGIAACTKSGVAMMPDGCAWPPSELPVF